MDNENDTTATGQDGTDTAEWTPPTRDEWEAAQTEHKSTVDKLKAASAESAQRKKALAELKQQHETEAEKSAREAQETAAATLRPRLLALTGTVASAFAQARPERLSALLKLVDFDQVDLDTGNGLDDEVARLREEFPEFFRSDKDEQSGSGGATTGNAEVGNRRPTRRQLSPMEQLAAQVHGTQQK